MTTSAARRVVKVPGLYDTTPRGYEQCIVANGFVYVAGQPGWDQNGKLVSPDFEPQARQAFQNVRVALEAAGVGMGDVVAMTVYLTDMRHLPEFRRARQEAMGEHMTAHTLLGVDKLADPGMLFEVQAVAALPNGSD